MSGSADPIRLVTSSVRARQACGAGSGVPGDGLTLVPHGNDEQHVIHQPALFFLNGVELGELR